MSRKMLETLAKVGVSKYWFKVNSSDSFQLHKNGTGDFVTVSSTGNVGINETNPGVKLQVITPDEQVTNFSSSVVDQLIYSQISANSSTAGVITGAAALELVGKANGSGHGRHAWIGAEGTSNTTFETKIKFKIRGNLLQKLNILDGKCKNAKMQKSVYFQNPK